MRKLLLLLATAAITTGAQAQDQTGKSIVFNQSGTPELNKAIEGPARSFANTGTSAKKTTATMDSWFSWPSIMASSSAKRFHVPTYQDSNVIYQYSNATSGIFLHGVGQCFDPTDSSYFGGDAQGNTSAGQIQDFTALPLFRVLPTDAYSVDSIAFPFKYFRNKNNDDTLLVEIIKAKRTGNTVAGIVDFQWAYRATLTDVRPDGKPQFVSPIIDANTMKVSDSLPLTARTSMKFILDQAFYADTLTSGYSRIPSTGVALPSPISVGANEVIVVYATVRYSGNYATGTLAKDANYSDFYTYDVQGSGASPRQNVNSCNTGLVATDQTKYHASLSDTQGFMPKSHNTAIPTIAFNADQLTPDMQVHIVCNTCFAVNVANVNVNLNKSSVYPNPANDAVSITYSAKNAADVTVSLINTVGQTVATQSFTKSTNGTAVFSTSSLSNGIYMYTVEAGGERNTGRVVVAH